jgi:hypothetical protein
MCSKPGQYHQTLGGAQSAMVKGTNDEPADQRDRGDMFGGAWRVLSSTTDRPSRLSKTKPPSFVTETAAVQKRISNT